MIKMKGKIYRLYNSECCYIGSTTKRYLSDRKGQHKSQFKLWIEGKQNWVSSFILYMFDEEVHIELLEEIEYTDIRTLQILEQSYIDKYRDHCVNERECGNRSSDPYLCKCGGRYTFTHRDRHFRCKKHIDYINSL